MLTILRSKLWRGGTRDATVALTGVQATGSVGTITVPSLGVAGSLVTRKPRPFRFPYQVFPSAAAPRPRLVVSAYVEHLDRVEVFAVVDTIDWELMEVAALLAIGAL